MSCSCGDNQKVNLIYACSGSANTGFLADHVTRMLMKNKVGSMTCLAAMGAGLSGFIESAKSSQDNIVVDGCPVSCGKKIFDKLGIQHVHYITTDYGVLKGVTPITEAVITDTAAEIQSQFCARSS